MLIRKASIEDLADILEIYDRARQYMAEKGNPNQWKNGYPPKELVVEDIESGHLHVCVMDGDIECVFYFAVGIEPTYERIEGTWLDDEEYGFLHRIASRGKHKGMLKHIVDYCFYKHSNLRIDTHQDNKIMQHLLEKYGFVRCGTIYLKDGSPRIAYHKNE